jgi:hypothetical protein
MRIRMIVHIFNLHELHIYIDLLLEQRLEQKQFSDLL